MDSWPQYRSHKVVRAMQITGKVRDEAGEVIAVFTEDCQAFVPSEPGMMRRADYGDYAVAYEGGFKSISPRATFESGYTRIEPE